MLIGVLSKFFLSVSLAFAASFLVAKPALATNIVVDSLADERNTVNGNCTLGEALRAAGNNIAVDACPAGQAGPLTDSITFGAAVTAACNPTNNCTINTDNPGYYQIKAGTSANGNNDDHVTVDGDDGNGGKIILSRNSGGGPGFNIGRTGENAVDVTLRNFEITGFNTYGVDANRTEDLVIEENILHDNGDHGLRLNNGNSSGATVQNNRIGVDSAGNPSGNGLDGITVNDGHPDLTITGNTISANGSFGIDLNHNNTTDSTISNNRIGTNVAGDSCGSPNSFGNEKSGIDIAGAGNSGTISNNIIGCNGRTQGPGGMNGDGIEATTNGADLFSVTNNYIGTNAAGADLGNHQNGIDLDGPDDWLIQSNTIAFNGDTATNENQDGIRVKLGSLGIEITQNSVYSNGFGIDLGPTGVTPNDVGDTDGGANNLQNFIEITDAENNGMGQYEVTFDYDFDAAEGPWVVEFFCNRNGGTQGRDYQDSLTITTPASATGATFSFTPGMSECDTTDNVITATVTNANDDTSEFSNEFNPTAISLIDFSGKDSAPTALIITLLSFLGLALLFSRHRARAI